MEQYVAYYTMKGMSPDLPVWVSAHNWNDAVNKFQTWRDRKETDGYGDVFAKQPIRIERDDLDTIFPN